MPAEDEKDLNNTGIVNSTPTKKTFASIAPKKLTKSEIQDRRKKVQSLRLRGLDTNTIAVLLQISQTTVVKDLVAIRRDADKVTNNFDQNKFIGSSFAVFDELMQICWNEYISNDKNVVAKLKTLDLIRNIQNDKIKALQDVGLIKKEPEAVTVTHNVNIPWNDELKDEIAKLILQKSLTTPLLDPIPIVEANNESPEPYVEAEIITEPSENID